MTIALCMIVRDEAASIGRCLESVMPLIDRWVIVDTGSTDGTQEIAAQALAGKPGELYERPWVNFGHNRSELLKIARFKADYLLLPDADDELMIEGELPELTEDCYNIRYTGPSMEWYFPRLVRGSLPWYYVGAAHAYLDCDEPFTQENLDVLKFLHHGGGKDRTEKFRRDAELLAKAAEDAVCDTRSWFYLAQSYRDMGLEKLACVVYDHRATLGGWPEEVFYSMYQSGVLRRDSVRLHEAWQFRPVRAEPLYWMARIAREQGDLAKALKWAKTGLEVPYPDDKLFVHKWIYDVGLQRELELAGGAAHTLRVGA